MSEPNSPVLPNRFDDDGVVCGIDEVGRGPLAGPVTAAAVVLPPDFDRSILADSKVLSERRREHASASLTAVVPSCVGVGWVWPAEIDELNIHHASLLAMSRAYHALVWAVPSRVVSHILVDGRFRPDLFLGTAQPPDPFGIADTHAELDIEVEAVPPSTAVVAGDRIEPTIMAASIVAKVARDRWMIRYAQVATPGDPYGFARHKGYPTAVHRRALLQHGPCPIHRRSFRGVPRDDAHSSR